MEILRTPEEMAVWAERQRRGGHTIGLVPTMGYFHEGHLALMRLAGRLADRVVVSLFVNPLQFGPTEDLASYPRDFDRDASRAAATGVDVLYAPSAGAMYPEEQLTTVSVRQLTEGLCGATRPGHFDGVATVVAKLFNMVRPHLAVFGQKDFQQLAVIRRMVRDLNFGLDIVAHPIVREADGLAMSSRNVYLDASQRENALCLVQAIRRARSRVAAGLRSVEELRRELANFIIARPQAAIDYIKVVDQETLEEQQVIDEKSRLALAVRIGGTRLIDNAGLKEGEEERV